MNPIVASSCSPVSSIQSRSLVFSHVNLGKFVLKRRKLSSWVCKANLITSPDFFEVGRLLGSYGFMNVTSYSGLQPRLGTDFSPGDIANLRAQEVGEGSVKIRLYDGRIIQGPFRGTAVIFKVYPGQRFGGVESDMMAANEHNAHASLQSRHEDLPQNLLILLGGFETKTGEQWLAFRNDGYYSAADYAKTVSGKISGNLSQTISNWNPFQPRQLTKSRRMFVIKILQGVMRGLAFMHNHEKLHQSLGPSSVILNTIAEREVADLVPRLRDLAFSVDIRFSYVAEGPGTLSEGLWRRASSSGAFTVMEKRSFGIADDIYEAGLLLAYLAFVPFCEPGVIDSLSLQRLLENTFRLDLEAFREYCLADEGLVEAVKFLDVGDGAGWELLQEMLNPDFRKRPVAEAVLGHRFLNGAVLST